jgi:hypothetical protein
VAASGSSAAPAIAAMKYFRKILSPIVKPDPPHNRARQLADETVIFFKIHSK